MTDAFNAQTGECLPVSMIQRPPTTTTKMTRDGLATFISRVRELGIGVPEPTEPEAAYLCGEIERANFMESFPLAFADEHDADGSSSLDNRFIQWRRAAAEVAAVIERMARIYGPLPDDVEPGALEAAAHG